MAIQLDTTLAELYELEVSGIAEHDAPLAHLNAFPCSDCAMTSHIPQNRKYLYQDSLRENIMRWHSFVPQELVKPWTEEERQILRQILAVKLLNVLGQRYSFVCGKMPVILFDPEIVAPSSQTQETLAVSAEYAKAEAMKTFSALAEHQRPIVSVCTGKTSLRSLVEGRIAVAMPFDGLEDVARHLISPDRHYFLLSKGCLANSGLPTPRGEVIQLETDDILLAITDAYPGFFPEQMEKLDTAKKEHFQSYIAMVADKVASKVLVQKLPFVVKTQQSSSGGGTHLILTEDQRAACLDKLRSRILPLLVSSVNSDNKHLFPASIIITDYVIAIRSTGVSFFVHQSGNHRILSATDQRFDKDGFWTGGSVDFSLQDQERENFDEIVSQAARFLHNQGYYGPVGLDVLEDKKGQKYIVDMNVRVPGSLPLGLLSGFFYREHGLRHGYIMLGVRLALTRRAFLAEFQENIEKGMVVIIAWFEEDLGPERSMSWTNLAMADETVAGLNRLIEKIGSYSLKLQE